MFQDILAKKEYDIESWVSSLSIDDLASLEDAVTSNQNPSGNLLYHIKPYMKFIPSFQKLEEGSKNNFK